MFWRKKVFLYAVFSFIAIMGLITASFTYGGLLKNIWPKGTSTPAGHKGKPRISAETVIREEIRYLCGDKTVNLLPTTKDFVGLDWEGLSHKFPLEEGWQIDDTVQGQLTLIKIEEANCPKHRSFRHLGLNQGNLAIFEGPLGQNDKVLAVEEIKGDDLPAELRTKLEQATSYATQEPSLQQELKKEFEFSSEKELNVWLENLEEFRNE